MWEFTNTLAAAVKSSRYPVWTRINNYKCPDAQGVEYNEKMRKTVGTSIDFIGLDPYSDVPNYLYTYGHGSVTDLDPEVSKGIIPNYATGENLTMVMENGVFGFHRTSDELHSKGSPKYVNADRLTLACLAGGSFLQIYDLCGPENIGLYRNTEGNHLVPSRRDVRDRLQKVNQMLLKLASDLASKQSDGAGGRRLLFFNPLSEEHYDNTCVKKIDGVEIRYIPRGNGVGIAVDRGSDEIAVASLTDADFLLKPDLLGKLTVELGSYDEVGHWNGEKETPYKRNGANIIIHLPAYGCVRVLNRKSAGQDFAS